VITCFAIDPQAEHLKEVDGPPPLTSALVTCSCCWQTYRYAGKQITRGTPMKNPARARRKARESKAEGAVIVAATIAAAIRLRGIDIKPSPKLTAVVKDSVELARRVLAEVQRSAT
jgi:hypothetical protein